MKMKKAIAMVLAVMLIVALSVAGTVAWLTATTEEVENTFTVGNIGNLGLAETTGTQYSVVPGVDIEKDPKITFTGNTIPAYVFLKIDAAGWDVEGSDTTYTYSLGTGKEMSWTLEGWTKLADGVYYKAVGENNTEEWEVIKDNKITVSEDITVSTISNFNKPLTFKAYAIQQADGGSDNDGKFTPAEAWAAVNP